MSIFVASQLAQGVNAAQAANQQQAQAPQDGGIKRFVKGFNLNRFLAGGAGIPRQLEVLDTPREKETGMAAYAVLGVFSLATLALLFYAIKSK